MGREERICVKWNVREWSGKAGGAYAWGKFVLEFGRSFSNQCNHYTDKTTTIRKINKKISLLGRVVHDLKRISKRTVKFVYDINHMYALRIGEN